MRGRPAQGADRDRIVEQAKFACLVMLENERFTARDLFPDRGKPPHPHWQFDFLRRLREESVLDSPEAYVYMLTGPEAHAKIEGLARDEAMLLQAVARPGARSVLGEQLSLPSAPSARDSSSSLSQDSAPSTSESEIESGENDNGLLAQTFGRILSVLEGFSDRLARIEALGAASAAAPQTAESALRAATALQGGPVVVRVPKLEDLIGGIEGRLSSIEQATKKLAEIPAKVDDTLLYSKKAVRLTLEQNDAATAARAAAPINAQVIAETLKRIEAGQIANAASAASRPASLPAPPVDLNPVMERLAIMAAAHARPAPVTVAFEPISKVLTETALAAVKTASKADREAVLAALETDKSRREQTSAQTADLLTGLRSEIAALNERVSAFGSTGLGESAVLLRETVGRLARLEKELEVDRANTGDVQAAAVDTLVKCKEWAADTTKGLNENFDTLTLNITQAVSTSFKALFEEWTDHMRALVVDYNEMSSAMQNMVDRGLALSTADRSNADAAREPPISKRAPLPTSAHLISSLGVLAPVQVEPPEPFPMPASARASRVGDQLVKRFKR